MRDLPTSTTFAPYTPAYPKHVCRLCKRLCTLVSPHVNWAVYPLALVKFIATSHKRRHQPQRCEELLLPKAVTRFKRLRVKTAKIKPVKRDLSNHCTTSGDPARSLVPTCFAILRDTSFRDSRIVLLRVKNTCPKSKVEKPECTRNGIPVPSVPPSSTGCQCNKQTSTSKAEEDKSGRLSHLCGEFLRLSGIGHRPGTQEPLHVHQLKTLRNTKCRERVHNEWFQTFFLCLTPDVHGEVYTQESTSFSEDQPMWKQETTFHAIFKKPSSKRGINAQTAVVSARPSLVGCKHLRLSDGGDQVQQSHGRVHWLHVSQARLQQAVAPC